MYLRKWCNRGGLLNRRRFTNLDSFYMSLNMSYNRIVDIITIHIQSKGTIYGIYKFPTGCDEPLSPCKLKSHFSISLKNCNSIVENSSVEDSSVEDTSKLLSK